MFCALCSKKYVRPKGMSGLRVCFFSSSMQPTDDKQSLYGIGYRTHIYEHTPSRFLPSYKAYRGMVKQNERDTAMIVAI